MVFASYKMRMRLREWKREYPVLFLLEFTLDAITCLLIVSAVTAAIYYGLSRVAPLQSILSALS